MNIGNEFLISGASYSPSILAGLSREEIAANLNDPTNPATQVYSRRRKARLDG